MKQKLRPMETIMNLVFFACGFIAIVFVLFISVYLIISGIPAIREIGLIDFLFGTEWASTAAEPKFGILPFILTSIYGTCGAIIIGVPVGFMTAVFLAKIASPKLAAIVRPAVDLLAGGASLIATALMTLTVNARHLFYGVSMVERYRDAGPAKPYLIFALTDETYSLVCSAQPPEGVDSGAFYFWISYSIPTYI